MSHLSELRKRVEAARGPSRELDIAICDAVLPRSSHTFLRAEIGPVLSVTASIDDALALVESKLPGQGWRLLEDALYLDRMSVKGLVTSDLPKIIILTLLRTLEQKEQGNG